VTKPNPMRAFDPRKVAHYEVANYVAYYQKAWPRLLSLTVGLVQEAFGLPLLRAIEGAYLVARAEIAAAPFPNNDIPRAEAYMSRFYAMLKRIYPAEQFDPAEAARLDVQWWVVHRELFANPENDRLTDALTDLWAYAYQVPRERILPAAKARADAILISDRWVRGSKDPADPVLKEEEAVMTRAYALLREAV
jgi:hypothetical protein